MEHRPRPTAGIALPARALQRPRGRLVRPFAALARRPRGPRARDGLGPGPGHLRTPRRSDELRRRPPTPMSQGIDPRFRERFIPLHVHRTAHHALPRPVPHRGPPEEVGGRREALAGDVLPGDARGLRHAELVATLPGDADAPAQRHHGEAGRLRRVRAKGRRGDGRDRRLDQPSVERGQDARRAVHDGAEDHPRAGLHGTRVDPATPDGVRAARRRIAHRTRQGNRRGDPSHGPGRGPPRVDLVLEEARLRRGAPAPHADGRRPDPRSNVRQGPLGTPLGDGDDGRALRDETRRARPRCVQHRIQEPHGLRDVHVVHRPRGEVPARDAAPLPVRADGALHAMDAVPRGVVPPRRGGDPHEGHRGRGHPARRELRDRGSPADPQHVVPAGTRDVRFRAGRRPREGRVQDAKEPRGPDDLHRRGPRQGEGREPRGHPGESAVFPRRGGRRPPEDHPEGGDRARTHTGGPPLLAGSPVLPDSRSRGVRRLSQSGIRRGRGRLRVSALRRPWKPLDGARKTDRARCLCRLSSDRPSRSVHEEPALGFRQRRLPVQRKMGQSRARGVVPWIPRPRVQHDPPERSATFLRRQSPFSASRCRSPCGCTLDESSAGRTRSASLSSAPGWSVSSCGRPYSRGFGSRDVEACETSNRSDRDDNPSFITSSSNVLARGSAMDLTYISLEKKDRVAVAWMNKPKANTYDADLMRDLSTMIDDVRFDDDIDVCVLASKLDGIWSAGADINLLASSTPDYKAMFCLNCQETLNKMESTPKL
ncbi:MAG: hypothetical protein E6K02_04280, partial [Methanobacteriota archaeon]